MSTNAEVSIAELVREGARLFDEGRFFEAHEAWEAHWLVEKDEPRRLLLQGLIQIAAAFHKLVEKDAPESAASLYEKGLAKLERCSAVLGGDELARFRGAVRACAVAVAEGRFERAMIPKCTVTS
jgi:predicted metal-dependent hydrolase